MDTCKGVVFPEMPKMKDFTGVTEDPAWIVDHYYKAVARWEHVCLKIAEAFKAKGSSQD